MSGFSGPILGGALGGLAGRRKRGLPKKPIVPGAGGGVGGGIVGGPGGYGSGGGLVTLPTGSGVGSKRTRRVNKLKMKKPVGGAFGR